MKIISLGTFIEYESEQQNLIQYLYTPYSFRHWLRALLLMSHHEHPKKLAAFSRCANIAILPRTRAIRLNFSTKWVYEISRKGASQHSPVFILSTCCFQHSSRKTLSAELVNLLADNLLCSLILHNVPDYTATYLKITVMSKLIISHSPLTEPMKWKLTHRESHQQ